MWRKYGLYFTWVFCCFGILMSLYFSELRNFEPCHLCWYQRILLFPLGIILGIAAYKNFYGIVPYVLPQILLGLAFSGYQIAIQEIPDWNPIELCGAGPKCTDKIYVVGLLTIPMLAFVGFLIISIMLISIWRVNRAQGAQAQSLSL